MSVMSRSGFSESLLAKSFTLALAIGLLAAAVDLHSLLHQMQDLAVDAASHGDHQHLDHGSVDDPCLACLFGLKSQSRPAEAPGLIARPVAHSRLAAVTISFGVAELSYRLPLSRAPPLS